MGSGTLCKTVISSFFQSVPTFWDWVLYIYLSKTYFYKTLEYIQGQRITKHMTSLHGCCGGFRMDFMSTGFQDLFLNLYRV